MNPFQEDFERQRRAKEFLPRIIFKPTEHWNTQEHKGKPLKAYEVFLGEEKLGRVLQQVQHTYKVHNRVRYGDRYTVRWQYDFPQMTGSHRLYEDTREKALLRLLMDMLGQGKLK